METMNIALPENMKLFVQQQVAQGGYSSVSEYFRQLIRDDQKDRARETLESAILQGLDSGDPDPLTDQDWKAIRRQVRPRHRTSVCRQPRRRVDPNPLNRSNVGMKRPAFTDEEQYVISYYKANAASSWLRAMAWHDLPYIVLPLAFVIWGMVRDSALIVFFAFALLLAFRIYDLFASDRWGHVYGAIFAKYDACFAHDDADGSPNER